MSLPRKDLLAVRTAIAAAPKGLTTRELSKRVICGAGPSRFLMPQTYAKNVVDALRRRGEVERQGRRYVALARPVELPDGWLMAGMVGPRRDRWSAESPHFSASGSHVRVYQSNSSLRVEGGAELFIHVPRDPCPQLDAIRREAARIGGANVEARRASWTMGLSGKVSAPMEAIDELAQALSRLSYELIRA